MEDSGVGEGLTLKCFLISNFAVLWILLGDSPELNSDVGESPKQEYNIKNGS